MSNKLKERRRKSDFTLPCPQCGAECDSEEVNKLQEQKEKTATDIVVLPKHYLELHCTNCKLDLWLTLDESGLPLPYN